MYTPRLHACTMYTPRLHHVHMYADGGALEDVQRAVDLVGAGHEVQEVAREDLGAGELEATPPPPDDDDCCLLVLIQ